jgi:nucleotide-binding universal stress UspA family protein
VTQRKTSAPPFRKIAVATDFATASAHAVTLATALAKRCGAELTVVNVVEPAAYSHIGAETAALERLARGTLDAVVARVRDDLPAARAELRVGRPAEELVAFAESNQIDLLVTGTHGRTTVDRWIVGSVAQALIRTCRTPVLTVHSAATPFRRLLVATDLGPSSKRSVELATELAAAFEAWVTLLHTSAEDTPAGGLKDVQGRLEEIAAVVRAQGARCDVVSRHGQTWSEIADEAATGSYDLVVVGTHDRSPLARWLLGSVALQVVRSALPPVLSVRAASTSALRSVTS